MMNFRLIFIGLFVISIVSCFSDVVLGPGLPDAPYNIYFTPTQIQRGELLTITFDLTDDGIKEWYFKDLTIDMTTHKIKYIGNSTQWPSLYNNSGFDQHVEFGLEVSDDLIEKYKGEIDKFFGDDNIKHSYVYATYFTYIDTSKIICKVPDNAVTGLLYVFGQAGTRGFSENKLVIIDASGDPIY